MEIMNRMRTFVRRLPQRQRGQGMTEYIIIVALIAVAAIGVYALFGQTIRNQVSGLAAEVAGKDSATDRSNAAASASSARTAASATKGMSSYGN